MSLDTVTIYGPLGDVQDLGKKRHVGEGISEKPADAGTV